MSKKLIERLRSGEPYDSLVKESVADRIEELERELERERIRLAACGVVALANTPDSATKARKMLPEYCSASLNDVIRAVDSEMALRQERDGLLADNARLREVMQTLIDEHEECSDSDGWTAMMCSIEAHHVADEALAITPAQSLARIRNQVLDECVDLCAGTVCGSQGFAGSTCCILSPGHAGSHSYGVPMAKTQRECAAKIRATTEPPCS